MTEREIFLAALKQPTAGERAAFLDQACGSDASLRSQIEALLAEHEQLGSYLEAPVAAGQRTLDEAPAGEAPGTVIGPYKLLEQIGEGGMGTVWMAQQTEPVKRLVAVKLIKAGMDSRSVIARFEAERQALALMDHLNIARVLDAGTTAAGRPYFVMDLVKGVPITRYCDEHRLTPRQRLELFIPVCHAIQHAHQKGIIHRDLKPSNVLVALYDGQPVPKVIDFGVAKATGQALTDLTLVTGFGALVGTLEYMSPEQAEINQLDIDTRSDIYSLGVLLYELLTGSPPFTRQESEKVGMLEMLRVIREQEPTRPSTKLSTAEGLPTLAANRGTEPAKLTRLVRGELDWIVMKAIEKDRNRRYETANGLVRDLQRYLADEPVQACPPSVGYRLRKFARRNKGPVLAAMLVLFTLLAGVAGITWKWLEAEHQKNVAQQKTLAEEAAKEAAQQISRELEKNVYEQAIALAFHEWQNGNPAQAARLIADCRPEFRGWEWAYLHRLCHSDQGTLAAHAAPLYHVAFSPDGRLIAGATGWYENDRPAGKVIVWDSQTKKELFTLAEHTRLVRSVAFSPDGKLLASAGFDPAVRVWDVAARRQIACHTGRGGWITCVAFSPDNQMLAAADGNWLRVWEVATGKEVRTVAALSAYIVAIAFSPDGTQIAGACSRPSRVRLWNVQIGKEIRTFAGHRSDLSSVAFSPDGKRLASSGWDNSIRVWDVASAREVYPLHVHSENVSQVNFSPDGKFLASASWDGTVRLWNASDGEEARVFRGHTGIVHSVTFSPDGERLASAGADHQVKIWDVMTEQEGRRVHFPRAHPYALAFSADGNLLAAADGSIYFDPHKTIALYDARTGLLIRKLTGHTGRVLSVAFNPCCLHVATGSTDNTVKIWDALTGDVLHTLRGHSGNVTGVAFTRDGKRLASSSADRTVRVWDSATGEECRVLRGHMDAVTGVAFAPDGRLVSASADRAVRVWDAADDTQCLVLNKHTDAVTGVAFDPDGRCFASAGADQTLRIWDAVSGRELLVLRGHTEPVVGLAYSPRGDRLVSASNGDHTVRLWDARTGRQLLALRQQEVLCVAFSPDGQRVASGTSQEHVHFWDAAPWHVDDAARSAAWFKHYAGQKQWDKAAAALARLERQVPGAPGLWRDRGHYFAARGKWSGAASDLDKAADLDRKKQEADLRESIRAKPDDAIRRNDLAAWLLHQDRLTEAELEARAAIKVDPKSGLAHCTLGEILYAAGKRSEAETEFLEALRSGPGRAGIHFAMGHAYAHAGEWEKAATAFGGVVELNPRDPWPRFSQAAYALAGGDVEGYRRVCAEALKLFGEAKEPYHAYITIRAAVLAPDAVPDSALLVQLTKKAMNEPPSAPMLFTLGMAHYRAEQLNDAVARLEEAVRVDPAWTHRTCVTGLALALVHHRLGHEEEAREWLERTVEQLERSKHAKWPAVHFPAHPADWVTCVILRKDAARLMGKAPVKNQAKK
jgi:WD40 repeat protein/serine/threonine protein kinase/Flp pilus assembly protein TadD